MYGSDADDVYRIGYDVRYILWKEEHLERGVLFLRGQCKRIQIMVSYSMIMRTVNIKNYIKLNSVFASCSANGYTKVK